jgi:hypothetical protein
MTPEQMAQLEDFFGEARTRRRRVGEGQITSVNMTRLDLEVLEALLLENSTLLREHGEMRKWIEKGPWAMGHVELEADGILRRIPDRSWEVKL